MKRRRVNVRKHRRRKKLGGSTIVKRHKRSLRSSIRTKTKDDWMKRRIAEEHQEQEMQEEHLVSLSPKEKWTADDWRHGGWSPNPIHKIRKKQRIDRSYHVPTYITKRTYEEKIQSDISNQTQILMGQLSVPDKLKYEIQQKAQTLYENIPKNSEYRHPLIVSAASIYLVSLEKQIFIPWSNILKLLDPKGKKWNPLLPKALRAGLQLDPALYRKIKTPKWRKERIRQITFGLHSELELPFIYYQYMSEKLDKNFSRLSNERDAQIAALLWRGAMEELRSMPRDLRVARDSAVFHEGLDFLGENAINTRNFYNKNKGFKLHEPKIIEEDDVLKEELWFLF